MAREIANLDKSGKQLKAAHTMGKLLIVNIKAQAFFKPALLPRWLPLEAIEHLRNEMHRKLMALSERCQQV